VPCPECPFLIVHVPRKLCEHVRGPCLLASSQGDVVAGVGAHAGAATDRGHAAQDGKSLSSQSGGGHAGVHVPDPQSLAH
jgi:hypothetical protein